MGDPEIRKLKSKIRREILQKRRGMSEEERNLCSERINSRLLASPLFRAADRICAFYPLTDEVNLLPLIMEARKMGKRIFLPRIIRDTNQLSFHEWREHEPLVEGPFGTKEPSPIAPPLDDPADLILIPGVAFDRKGGRLGYGKGYYDFFLRELPSIPYLLAPAFSLQVVEQVPLDSWDHKVDAIVTEGEWIDSS